MQRCPCRNRLASNSLLESLVFAKRAAGDISQTYQKMKPIEEPTVNASGYDGCEEKYKLSVLEAIEKEKNSHK